MPRRTARNLLLSSGLAELFYDQGGETYARAAVIAGFGDTPALDAFGRLRVADPVSLFNASFQYDASPLLWVAKTAGTASLTHLPNESAVQLAVGNANGDRYVYQSRRDIRYQPGKSQRPDMTMVAGAGRANCAARCGYYDDSNGVFFQVVNGAASMVLRSKSSGSVVDTVVPQASWNRDRLDGNGPSGVVLDASKGHIFTADLEWLSLGTVRVGLIVGGKTIYVHHFDHANMVSGAYMTTATLPVRYELFNTAATGGATTMKAICAAVMSEGGQENDLAIPFSDGNGASPIGVTTRRPVFSIRPKATFNAIVNRGDIIPREAVFRVATNDAYFEIIYGGTLTGPSWASADANSIVERDVAATAISGGVRIGSLSVPSGGGNRGSDRRGLSGRLPLTLDVDGANPINLSVVATSYAATSNVSAELNWDELR